MSFEQSISVNDANYDITITNQDITAVGEGRFYQLKNYDSKEARDERLKRGLRRQDGLEVKASLGTNDLTLMVRHPLFSKPDVHVLALVEEEITNFALLDRRLTTLETGRPRTIWITENMLGPCVTTKGSAVSSYDVKTVFSHTPIFASESQAVTRMAETGIKSKIYTVYTKRSLIPKDIVGSIVVGDIPETETSKSSVGDFVTAIKPSTKSTLTINLNIGEFKNNPHTPESIKKDDVFMEHGWICKVDLPDSVYRLGDDERYYIIIKDKKLFFIFGDCLPDQNKMDYRSSFKRFIKI